MMITVCVKQGVGIAKLVKRKKEDISRKYFYIKICCL